MATEFSSRCKSIIRRIPPGKVTTYGLIAAASGQSRAARQVARLLHSSSKKDNLPWHRVINRMGKISLPPFEGYDVQKALLLEEGVRFGDDDSIDLEKYLWFP
jgi:methylated-DNA-protein-cysteine methyltransferase related protein